MWFSDFLAYDFNPRDRYFSSIFLGNNGNLALDALFNDKKNSEVIVAYEMCWESMICEIYGNLEVFLLNYYFIIGFLHVGKYNILQC